MTRIERKIWNAEHGEFRGTGRVMNVDIDTLESASERTRVSGGRFLRGPIPWSWIASAKALHGQALPVGLCIWRLAGAKKSHTVFLGNSDLKPLGIDRAAKSRALRALEQAGLIKIARQHGRFPEITLLCASGEPNDRIFSGSFQPKR